MKNRKAKHGARAGSESPMLHQQKKDAVASFFCWCERCVPQTERDAHFVRDVSFGSDVRAAREDAELITSL